MLRMPLGILSPRSARTGTGSRDDRGGSADFGGGRAGRGRRACSAGCSGSAAACSRSRCWGIAVRAAPADGARHRPRHGRARMCCSGLWRYRQRVGVDLRIGRDARADSATGLDLSGRPFRDRPRPARAAACLRRIPRRSSPRCSPTAPGARPPIAPARPPLRLGMDGARRACRRHRLGAVRGRRRLYRAAGSDRVFRVAPDRGAGPWLGAGLPR